jgi:hypothetical protein
MIKGFVKVVADLLGLDSSNSITMEYLSLELSQVPTDKIFVFLRFLKEEAKKDEMPIVVLASALEKTTQDIGDGSETKKNKS